MTEPRLPRSGRRSGRTTSPRSSCSSRTATAPSPSTCSPRPDDPRRPNQRPGDHGPHRLRQGRLRRADRDRKRLLIVGGPPRNPPAADGATRPGEARPQRVAAGPAEPTSRRSLRPAGRGLRRLRRAAQPKSPPAQAKAPTAAPEARKPTEPKARIPLDEVESIRSSGRTTSGRARSSGQPNVDLTVARPAGKEGRAEIAKKPRQEGAAAADDALGAAAGTRPSRKVPRVEPKKNGIRDVRLALFGPEHREDQAGHRQLPDRQGADRLAARHLDSHDWPLVLRRSGTESSADLFLEPPPGRLLREGLSRSTSSTRTARTPTPTSRPTSTPTPSSPSTPSSRRPPARCLGST